MLQKSDYLSEEPKNVRLDSQTLSNRRLNAEDGQLNRDKNQNCLHY